MRRWLTMAALLAATGLSAAPAARSGRWKPAGEVKELYPTPQGAVYRFEPSPHFSDLHRPVYSNGQKHADNCTCRLCRVRRNLNALQLPLKNLRNGRDDHYVVIEFQARLFPALEKNQDPAEAALAFYFAANSLPGVDGDSLYQVYRILPDTVLQENLIHRFKTEMHERLYGRFYLPLFDWITVRMVADVSFRIWQLYVNGALYQCIDLTKWEGNQPKFSSVGLFVETGKKRPTTFEITRPVVLYLATDEAVAALPPVLCERYDYAPYFAGPRKRVLTPAEMVALDRDNPDRHYAAARKILDDPEGDPLAALKELRAAAKEGHLPARLMLATCQWRGLGMARNPAAAVKALRDMPEYPPAAALATLIEWKESPSVARPTAALIDRLRRTFADAGASPDLDRLRSFCIGTATLAALRQSPEISIKQLLRLRPFPRFRHLTRAEIDTFLPLIVPDDRLHDLDDTDFFRAILTRADQSGMVEARRWMAEWLRSLAFAANADPALLEAAEARLDDPEILRDDACALLRYRLRWERGQLTPEELDTPANRLRFRNAPGFALLRLALLHPNTPGVKELRRGDRDRALALWREDLSPESRMMLAMAQWEVALGSPPVFGATTAGQTPAEPLWREAFNQLAEAADDRLPEAELMLARLSLEPLSESVIRPRRLYPASTAVEKLTAAADSGDAVACMALARHYRDAGGAFPAKVQSYLRTAANLGDPEACRLLGEMLLRRNLKAEAIPYLTQSGEAGDPAAWSILAQQASGDEATALWRRFVETDRRARLNDPLDFLEPALPINQQILNGIPTEEDWQDAMKRRNRARDYEEWRKWGRQSEGKIGGTSLSF